MEASDIDLVVAGTKKAVTMIEGSSKIVSEDDMIKAVELAHENIKKLCACQEELAAKVAKPAMQYQPFIQHEALVSEIRARYLGDIKNLASYLEKKEREDAFAAIRKRAKEELGEQFADYAGQIGAIIDDLDYEVMRERVLTEKKRADGRGLKDIRPIDIMVGPLPRPHGSAIFTRGQTQSLGIVTLGTVADSQKIDAIEGESYKRFMLHYNFPPFSVGEVGKTGGLGRGRSGTACLPSARLKALSLRKRNFLIRSALCLKFSNRTVRLLWPRVFRAHFRFSTPACRSKPRWRVLPWGL
jgi:polyribonucleotide nucleotidyltransferase